MEQLLAYSDYKTDEHSMGNQLNLFDNLRTVVTFRFNLRTSQSRGLVFRGYLEQSVTTEPVIRAEIAYGYDWLQRNK